MDPLGGSHAQRDIFWMMLSDAAAKGSDRRLISRLADFPAGRKVRFAGVFTREHYVK
jgi:hypothetical protein